MKKNLEIRAAIRIGRFNEPRNYLSATSRCRFNFIIPRRSDREKACLRQLIFSFNLDFARGALFAIIGSVYRHNADSCLCWSHSCYFYVCFILFQDAYLKIAQTEPTASPWLVGAGILSLLGLFGFLSYRIWNTQESTKTLPETFGSVQELGKALYLDFFFPFEAVILLFLVAMIGTVYIGKREI